MKPGRLYDPHLSFEPEFHRYTWRGKELEGVTAFLSRFKIPFESETISARVAKKRGVDASKLMAEWEEGGKVAADLGTGVHGASELIAREIRAQGYYTARNTNCPHIQGVYKFYEDHPELMVGTCLPEVRICHPRWGLAGTVDLLASVDGVVGLLDWKTNRRLEYIGYERMRPPLGGLDDCHIQTYSLQLTLYKRILEDRYGLDVHHLSIIWLDGRGGYERHSALQLEHYADRLIAHNLTERSHT